MTIIKYFRCLLPLHTQKERSLCLFINLIREREKKEGKDFADSGFLWVRANFKNEYKGESLKKVFFFPQILRRLHAPTFSYFHVSYRFKQKINTSYMKQLSIFSKTKFNFSANTECIKMYFFKQHKWFINVFKSFNKFFYFFHRILYYNRFYRNINSNERFSEK